MRELTLRGSNKIEVHTHAGQLGLVSEYPGLKTAPFCCTAVFKNWAREPEGWVLFPHTPFTAGVEFPSSRPSFSNTSARLAKSIGV